MLKNHESQIFVGRQEEIDNALSLLRNDRSIWLIHFWGDGGIGKTKLLEALGIKFTKHSCFVPDLIDLYDFANQSKDGLLSTLSNHLGNSYFPQFSRLLTHKPDYIDAYNYELELVETFVDNYSSFAERNSQIVLRFDTLENIQGKDFLSWLFRDFLPRLHSNTLIFTAGREYLSDENLNDHFTQRRLIGLSLNDSIQYAEERFKRDRLNYDVNFETFERIYSLAEGRPILIALAVDWILNNADPEILSSIPIDEFERKMVTWVRELPTLENKAILYMAVIYKRFDAEMLAALANVTIEAARDALSHLKHFAFMKYRDVSHEYALHDEMRYLVGKHAGYPLVTRQEIARQTAELYRDKISRITEKEGRLEKRNLEIEYLYYSLNSNVPIDGGFLEAIRLFDKYRNDLDIDFCRLLLELLETQLSRFEPEKFAELEIRRAWLHYDRHEYAHTLSILDMLSRQTQLDLQVQIDRFNILGLIAETTNIQEALNFQHECRKLMEFKSGGSDGDPKGFAQIYRKIATLNRDLGNFEDARHWNEMSMEIDTKHGDKEGIAASLNNIANLDRLKGDYIHARENARDALEMRQNLQVSENKKLKLIGLSWRTIGLIERDAGNFGDAVNCFQRALEVFEKATDEVESGKALANLGSICYWREVHQSGFIPNPKIGEGDLGSILFGRGLHLEPEHYLREDWQESFAGFRWERGKLHQRAIESRNYLEKSESLFKRLRHEGDLAETLNHKGRLLIHFSDWFSAAEALSESLRLARTAHIVPLVMENLVSLILVNYLKQTADEISDLLDEIIQISNRAGQRYNEPLSRLELILGNIDFEKAEWDPAIDSYILSFKHYIEACILSLNFSRSRFEAAKYVLRDRLERTETEFIEKTCDYVKDMWNNDSRKPFTRDSSLNDVIRNVKIRKMIDTKKGF